MPSIRYVTAKSGGVKRSYPQLVESYRRADGRPACRVLLPLKDWQPQQIENLKIALQAARKGSGVVVAADAEQPPKPDNSLEYLDIAVALRLWEHWGLGPLLDSLLGARRAVPSSSVVAMLVLQRLVSPASKLAAERWYPTTALVELLGITPAVMNNDRLHYVLEDLERVEAQLMESLTQRYHERAGSFAALFTDVTDTWFEGRGPEFAERGKTKAGHIRRKIGIVVLCNEDGYPLRWLTVPGNRHDSKSMLELLDDMPKPNWLRGVPVVLDRALGKPAHLRALNNIGLAFLTAMTSDQIEPLAGTELPRIEIDLQRVDADNKEEAYRYGRKCAQQAGFKRVDDRLFVYDLGVVECEPPATIEPSDQNGVDKTVQAMTWGRAIEGLCASGQAASIAQAARMLGIDRYKANRCAKLTKLDETIQQQILEGKAEGLSLNQLRALTTQDLTEQRTAFAQLCATIAPHRSPRLMSPMASATKPADPLELRLVAYFNPEICLDKALKAEQARARILTGIEKLNQQLVSPRSQRSRDSAAGAVYALLKRESLVDVIDFDVVAEQHGGKSRWQVKYTFKKEVWEKRRRTDGLSLLAAHKSLSDYDAISLCRLYRSKDVIEKAYETLKNVSIISIHPVRHRTETKVKAHVTICMLALLLERTLANMLDQSQDVRSPHAALQLLQTCRLNHYENGRSSFYVTTKLKTIQSILLNVLGMSDLADDHLIADRILPR